jgi:hypothetical protein
MFSGCEFAWVMDGFWVRICLGYGCFVDGNLLGLWLFSRWEFAWVMLFSGWELAWVMVVFWVGICLGYGCFLDGNLLG